MSRLIDADALKEQIKIMQSLGANIPIMHMIENTPTVDAEPVRHGHWIYEPKDAVEMMFTLPKCSECGHESADALNYCSYCGAKMDEVEENG